MNYITEEMKLMNMKKVRVNYSYDAPKIFEIEKDMSLEEKI